MALLLTSIGLYGLLSHSVARRVNEIGVRMALGARSFQVLRLVMSQIFILVIIGLAAGLGSSIVIHVALQPFVYGVALYEPTTLIASAAHACCLYGGRLPAGAPRHSGRPHRGLAIRLAPAFFRVAELLESPSELTAAILRE